MTNTDPGWLCCQLGARDHYVVPRALQRIGLLRELITDLWIRPGSVRFHPDLSSTRITTLNIRALSFELKTRISGATGWNLISKRNDWFQGLVAQLTQRQENGEKLNVFAYSYAAEGIFKVARERGWRTVLGQIDPGPAEARIVAKLESNGHSSAPPEYWRRWRNECELADQIVVNSRWSREALLSEGIAAEKIRVIPLAFEPNPESESFQRSYPNAFTSERPLRVLFLGQINVRKGVLQLFDAIKKLSGEPIAFWFVGPLQVDIPHELRNRIKWFGIAPRQDVSRYYRDADVFILPTLSDGFGLTQLEAQSWKLPVIASRNCGDVVTDGFNGVLLEEVSADAIANALLQLLRSPATLHAMSENSRVDDRFSLPAMAAALSSL